MIENEWLNVKNLVLYFKNKKILDQITFNLSIKQNTVIIGPNGSGKSTLIRTITKHIYPKYQIDSHIKIFGEDNINIWKLRTHIGFLITEIDSRIKNTTLVKDVILSGFQGTYGLVNYKLITAAHIKALNNLLCKMNLNGISDYYSDLSDGQKRRVLIARAIVNKPKVLILDEPTSMLDIKCTYELLDSLSKLVKDGITLLYVTNNIQNIILETERVILIKKGKIIADGDPNKILTSKNLSYLYEYDLNVDFLNGFWRISPSKEFSN
ncbi:ABC transporter ATP-binding protein [Prochlorococcus marinus]|uniref:ABC transporter ATP-binding protein n=1 Tax=Prochlorococcus marinus TaxID=1219 RepID=UPI0022B48B56|nr:ATP-binding cassette domain-containing protein [Prochlorococcus marinus]